MSFLRLGASYRADTLKKYYFFFFLEKVFGCQCIEFCDIQEANSEVEIIIRHVSEDSAPVLSNGRADEEVEGEVKLQCNLHTGIN